jgi:hypothetical protein
MYEYQICCDEQVHKVNLLRLQEAGIECVDEEEIDVGDMKTTSASSLK